MPRHRYSLLPILIMILLALSGLSACKPLHIPANNPSSENPTSTPSTENTKPAPTPLPTPTSAYSINPQDLQGTQINLWHPWSGDERAEFHSIVVEFNQTNAWGITVNVEAVPGLDQLDERVQSVWASEQLPDLVVAYRFQAQNWQKIKPLVQDWRPYLSDSLWGIPADEMDLFYKNLWQNGAEEDFEWGIPARKLGQVLFYNETLAKELGFSNKPLTTEDFRKQACAAKLIDEQTNLPTRGGWLLSQDYPTILGWMTAFNSQVLRTDGKGYQFNTPEVKETYTYLRKLYDQGCFISSDDVMPADALAQRTALTVSGNNAEIPSVEQAFKNAASNDRWSVIPFPSPDGTARMNVYGLDFILLKSDERTQLASWLFVKWMLSAEVQTRMALKMSALPLRSDVLTTLKENPNLSPANKTVLEWIPGAVAEPTLPSWKTVRWVVSDSSKQLFAWYFTPEQMPTLLKLLQDTAQSFYESSTAQND